MALAPALPGPARAQVVDTSSIRLAWGPLNILLMPDTLNGVGLWTAWSASGERRGLTDGDFVGHYDPTAVRRWLDQAELLLLPDRSSPLDPPRFQTSTLEDLTGGRLYAARLNDGKRWSNEVYISISSDPEDAKPLQFAVERKHAARLLEALRVIANRSGLRDHVPPGGTTFFYANPADSASCPERITQRSLPYPPHLLERRIEGDVWFSMVVDSTGVVLEDSLRVLLSDHAWLTHEAARFLARERFRPATRAGAPVSVLVYQRITYRIRP
jgi:hypothetical protein